MKITFLGTGTSFGIPVINCNCECCTSKNPHDTRFRSSIKVESSTDDIVVVDTGPEFRLQALKYGLPHLDALFFTHSHADHVHGLDDVRIFARVFADPAKNTKPLKVYANSKTNADIKNRFDYVFKPTQFGGGKPSLDLIDCEKFSKTKPINVGSLNVVPVPMLHGSCPTTGWIFSEKGSAKSFAYLTDCSFISDESIQLVKDCDIIVVDALREKTHSTHFNFEQAIEFTKKTNCKEFYFIHMCHEHTETSMNRIIFELRQKLCVPADVKIQGSFDGLVLQL